jgi:ferrous-iron efflux pump FieF
MAATHSPHGKMSTVAAGAITQRVARLSVGAALLLVVLKGGAYLASGSVAMLSSLADSGLDVLASIFTLLAVRYAAAPPDAEHRFGHGKAEAFAGLIQGVFVAISATLVVVEAMHRLANPHAARATALALGVMIVSMAITGALVWVQSRAIKQTGSLATAGDRAHYFTDFAANGAVILGLIGSGLLGLTWADPAASLVVTLYLFFSAYTIWRGAADHLMDRELSDSERDAIIAIVLQEPGILGVHALRTRAAGAGVHIELHADVHAELTVREAHVILVGAEARLHAVYPGADVIIHADPHEGKQAHGQELLASTHAHS